MKATLALVALLLIATPALAQETPPDEEPGLSNQDLARLTLAISEQFDVMEERLQATLDERLATQEEAIAELASQVAALQADVDGLAVVQTNQTERLNVLTGGLNDTQAAIAGLGAKQLGEMRNQTVRLQKDIHAARTDLSPVMEGLGAVSSQNQEQSRQIDEVTEDLGDLHQGLLVTAGAGGLVLVLLFLRRARTVSGHPGAVARFLEARRERRATRRAEREVSEREQEAELERRRHASDDGAASLDNQFEVEGINVVRHEHAIDDDCLDSLNKPGGGSRMKAKRFDWKRVTPWILIGLYVVSPIDLDPGLPFTDLAAIGLGIWNEHKRRKQ